MKKVPKMISTKDIAYIKDMFNWNLVAYKKIDFYKNDVTDDNLLNLFNDINDMHYDFCNKLITILESGEENGG